MIKIVLDVSSFSVITETYAENSDYSSIILPVSVFSDFSAVSTGDSVEITIRISDSATTIIVRGTVKWKRPKDIKMPTRIIPAGVGVMLDEESSGLLVATEQKNIVLSDINEPMIAGNYIKIRKDLAEKYNKNKDNASKNIEKRSQPRIAITIPVEVFSNNKIARFVTKNISIEGMCIEIGEPTELGEELVIVFEDSETERQFFLKAEVVRFEKDASGKQTAVGVKFNFENQAQQKDLMRFLIHKT